MTSIYIAVAQLVLYAAGAMLLYLFTAPFVVKHRISALAAGISYWAALALAPSLLVRAGGSVGNYLYANAIVVPHAAWDVGLAMWLFIGMWACYLCGFIAACLASWRFHRVARRNADAHAA